MKTKTIQYLLALVLMVWIVPWQGKRLLPAWFDSNLIQWGSVGLLAILCPIGALLSMSLLAGKRRRVGYCSFIGFTMPVLFLFFVWGVSPAFFAKSSTLLQPGYKEFDAIAKLVEGSRDSQVLPDKRIRAASLVYRLWGVAPVLLTTDGNMVAYLPTVEDERSRHENLDGRRTAEKSLALIHWQLKQIPYLPHFFAPQRLFLFLALVFMSFANLRNRSNQHLQETPR